MGNKDSGIGPMHRLIRLLLVEDNPADVELMVAVLKRAGYPLTFEAVDQCSDFRQSLLRGDYDLILCDHNLRTWNGLEALEILRQSQKDIPFVVVTATLGDEAAVDYIKQGAADYVLKHRLERLPLAVRQALRDKAHREEAARLQEQVFAGKREWELTFDSVPEPVMLLNSSGGVVRANQAVVELAAKKFSEVIGGACWDVFPCNQNGSSQCPHRQTLETGQSSRREELMSVKGRLLECTASPLRDPNGNLSGTVIVLHDLTERRCAEEALRDREEELRLLLDSTAEGIYGLDLEGRCTFCNTASMRMLGYARPEEVVGRLMHALIHSRKADGSELVPEECPVCQAFLQGRESHISDEVLWRADGTSFPAEYWAYPIRRNGEVLGAVVAFLDITEHKRAEEQLRQAAKMEAIGRLAGGVAHDFNNLLTIINGYAQMILDHCPADHPNHLQLKEVLSAGKRAAALTRQLLAFGRRQVLSPRVLDLNQVVQGMGGMLRRLIREDVELVISTHAEPTQVKADPGQIEQVVMNLAVNARDAMPQGGRLTIEIVPVTLDAEYAARHAEVAPGPFVLLAVSDTGTGMDAETQAHIFEPFFTTKEKGQGTGLGLATVYGIVKQSGGHIWVYSEPGHGSTFKVYLPSVEVPSEQAPGSPEQPRPSLRGSETVLLVEDESGVRGMVRDILAGRGYTVLEARHAEDAFQVAETHRGPIHLLLTDIIMPGVNGRELAEQLMPLHREMRVLLMSGYTESAVLAHVGLDSDVAFLPKPFTPEALAEKVRQLLDAPPRTRDTAA